MIRASTESEFLPSAGGQPLARSYFERACRTDRLAHAYLLWGEDGSGKRAFAEELAQALLCADGDPCGQCASCRSIANGNHPSVHVFGPAEGKVAIDIDTVRRLSERVHLKDRELKVIIVDPADSMGEPAANALLKTLEEPPPETLLILIARSTGTLLSTIVSRCHRVPFLSAAGSAELASDGRRIAAELRETDFFARSDPKVWLSDRFPGAETTKEAVRSAVDLLIAGARDGLLEEATVDGALEVLNDLFELRAALDGNVHADLVFERLLARLRR